MLTTDSLPALQRAIAEAGVDGWLLYDFRGVNPVSAGVLELRGMLSRRIFVYVPKSGVPTAITHNIEQGPWRDWPAAWKRERYSTWQELEGYVAGLVKGKKIAMEYSPGDAVPYVDYIPAGVLEMIRAAGATVVTSGEIVTKYYAVWTEPQMASHVRAAEQVRATALEAFAFAGAALAKGAKIHEHEVQRFIMDSFVKKGMEFDHDPIVAAGANAANAHYSPSENRPRALAKGELLLIDLWAREPGGLYADQTFMAALGPPSARATEVWTAVRDARDAAVARLQELVAAGKPIRGGEIDDAARGVITKRGFGKYFTHRTGHSIDMRQLHGSGPHIDNFETREERFLVPGAGFSIEPGVYIEGEIGVRSEVNAFLDLKGRLVVTPKDYQKELPVF
jgi:Xaa-Pro aminopeptidase